MEQLPARPDRRLGHHVGLPDGQFSNSGSATSAWALAGWSIRTSPALTTPSETGEFTQNAALAGACDAAVQSGGKVHVIGLLSPGGVHSHERHIHAFVRMAAALTCRRLPCMRSLMVATCRRKSAAPSIDAMQAVCAETGGIATVSGRFYAMDRDKRWERVEPAYHAMVEAASAHHAPTAKTALDAAYARDERQFVRPTVISHGAPIRMAMSSYS